MNDSTIKINHICILIITGILLTLSLHFAKSVLVPFVFSLVIYEALLPVVYFFERRLKLGPNISALLAFVAFLSVFAILILVVGFSLEDFLKSADIYKENLAKALESVLLFVKDRGIIERDFDIVSSIKNLPMFGFLRGFAANTASIVGDLSLIGLFVGFLLFGTKSGLPENHFFAEVNLQVSKYLNTKFITSTSTAILFALLLWAFGSDLILVFAILTFVLNFIPSIGSVFATLIPFPLLALKLGFGVKLAICMTLLGLVQFVIGNIIEPKMMGENLELHPITILIFLLFWGLIWGVPGMFLAVPITAILKIMFEKIEVTKPLAELLEGKLP